MIIRVVTETNISLKQIFDDYTSAILTREFAGAGSFEVHFDYVPEVAIGDVFIFDDDVEQCCTVERIYNNLSGGDPTACADFCVSGRTMNSVLDRRVTVPAPDSDGWRRWSNAYPSKIIRDMVYYNADVRGIGSEHGGTGTEYAQWRKFFAFVCSTEISAGTQMDFDTRYENLLDECIKVCEMSGLGFNVRLSGASLTEHYAFDVLVGVNRTQSNSYRYVFSTDFDNVSELTYEEDHTNYKNYAYVLGQGEGAERRIQGASPSSGSSMDFYHREMVVDARDIPDENSEVEDYDPDEALMARGQEKLAELAVVKNFEVEVVGDDFKTKWDLGDTCIVLDKNSGKQISAQVLSVTQTWEGGDYTVSATVGNMGKTLNERLSSVATAHDLT